MTLDQLTNHASDLKQLAAKHGLLNLRVFGSAARQGTSPNDIDLLVDTGENTSLLDLGAMQYESEALLGMRVDVLTTEELPEAFRSKVLAEAVPL